MRDLPRLVRVHHGVFAGFLTHTGHTYHATSTEEILNILRESCSLLSRVRNEAGALWSSGRLSIGDTPSCSVADDFSAMDEIRPGCFVFYDLTQHLLGACSAEEP